MKKASPEGGRDGGEGRNRINLIGERHSGQSESQKYNGKADARGQKEWKPKNWKRNIGIVGTEAMRITMEDIVSNKKKIWSLPIALAVVLMLVAVASMAVLAQTTSNKTITVGVGAGAVNDFDRTVERIYSSAGSADGTLPATGGIATVGIAPTSAVATDEVPAINGLDTTPISGVSGFQLNHSLFEVTAGGVVQVKQGDDSGAANLVKINADDGANVYTLSVNVFIDTDTGTDNNTTDDAAAELTANQGARPGFEAATGVDDSTNDLDELTTLTVTVRILKAEDAAFAAIPGMAAANDLLYGTNGQSKGVPITGLRSGLNVVPEIVDATGSTTGAGIVDGSTAFYAEVDAQNVVWIKYNDDYDPTDDTNNGALLGTDGAFDATNTAATANFTVSVDTDPSFGCGDNGLTPTGDGDGSGVDGTKYNHDCDNGTTPTQGIANVAGDDETVVFEATVTLFDILRFTAVGTDDAIDGSADAPYSFSLRSNASMGTQAGVIGVDGSAAGEDVDVIVRGSGSGVFTAEPRMAGTSYNQVVVKAARQLTTADEGMHELLITINGRALPTRTEQAHVKVQVTASNPAPTSQYDADNPLVLEINETDKDVGTLIGADDDLKIDLEDFVADDSASNLRFTISGTGVFTTNGSDLTVTGDVPDSTLKDGTGLEEDDTATTTVDESIAVYIRDDGGKFGSDGSLSETGDKYADITYKFNVQVQDAANTLTIPVVATLNVNEPSKALTEGLPAGVTYDADYTMHVDDDNDDMTPSENDDNDPSEDDTPVDAPTYFVTASYSDREVPVVVVDLSMLVSDSDAGDDLKYDVSNDGDAAHLVDSGSEILLTYLPPGAKDAPIVDVLMVDVRDGFNPATDDAETEDMDETIDDSLRIEISVTEIEKPVTSNFIGISVAENGTVCMQDGAEGCSLAGVVADGVAYSIESGVDGGETDYAVANDGTITVMTAPNFEDGNNPAFLVNVEDSDGELAGLVSVRVTVTDVNEAPEFTDAPTSGWVAEDAQDGHTVMTMAGEDGVALVFAASDEDAGDAVAFSIIGSNNKAVPFKIDSSSGAVTVDGNDKLDYEVVPSFDVVITASDGSLSATHNATIQIGNSNEAPEFVNPTLEVTIPEDTASGTEIADYEATDVDDTFLEFSLKNQGDSTHFALDSLSGGLSIADMLDYEQQQIHLVEINVTDPFEATAEIQLTVNVTNVNDNYPQWNETPAQTLTVAENTARGTTLSNYAATDADGQDETYSLGGDDAKSFSIDGEGNLKTLESLDADRQVPCGSDGCSVTVYATDVMNSDVLERGPQKAQSIDVRITVVNVEDSVSTVDVSKANPVPGTEMGNKYSSLAGTKTGGDEYLWNLLDCAGMLDLVGASDSEKDRATYCAMWDGLSSDAKAKVSAALDSEAPNESPYDLPATMGSAPHNFVETEWANWGTILRIEVTAESPGRPVSSSVTAADDGACEDGNQCVIVKVISDSAEDTLHLRAYRSAEQENKFVAAVRLVEYAGNSTSDDESRGVNMHTDGGVPRLSVDEEDEIEIEFGNLRDTIDVENEDPEISNFAPEHETAFDDADVDYTFTVTDSQSGLPDPEDLPDNNGDADYMPVVALISNGQCETFKDGSGPAEGSVLNVAAHVHENETLYCPGTIQGGENGGEYVAGQGSWGFLPIRDDKDFDEIDNGYDVETTIVLTENHAYYVTFVACDRAGNCTFYDPDGNADDVELAQVTVDTVEPEFIEARTGVKWDSTDDAYEDDRSYIQVIFDELTQLNPATVEADDFVIEGHTVKAVYVYDPDLDDVVWADSGDYADGTKGNPGKTWRQRGSDDYGDNWYQDVANTVFIELEDELLADETPDVTIVPNGVEDAAGNEQDDGDDAAKDWISPRFTIVSIVSQLETAQDEVLAGDGDEVTVVVTSDERLDATRPTVTVTYVNAPAGSVDTKGTASCEKDDGTDGTRDRGEIVHAGNDKCQDSGAAVGGTLNNHVEKVSNTEWIVTVVKPGDTGYYNFHITGKDRSQQSNEGSEGVAANKIVTKFFDSDGDVNVDDAVYWEGDINLPKPNVRVSGNVITDNEPAIEFRSPLFVEIDFTRNHMGQADCGKSESSDHLTANCMNENSEYAEDNFDDIVITMFELDGVDMTDSVRTTDDQTFLVTLENVALGDHTAKIQAMDVAGNTLEDILDIDFEVSDRDPFSRRLNPGWNLVSLPGEPADSSIGSVFGPGVEVRTVYTYDPVIPGGWMVAVRETLDSDWQGDLTEISGQRGYWVLSDAIQDWEVSIPRLAGGAAGTGTPIQPPVIPLYAGWNLIPVTDISGNALDDKARVSAEVYLQSLDDGLDLARVLGFDTITNQWETVLDPDMQMNNTLKIGSAYWVFVREAASLVPSGYVGGGAGD